MSALRVLALTAGALLTAATGCASTTAARPAELVVRGTILTMDPARPTAKALAVRDGRVVAVGTDAEVDPLVGASTRQVTLQGQVAMPGFIDCHTHLGGSLYGAHTVAEVAPTKDALLAQLRAAVDQEPTAVLTHVGWIPVLYSGTAQDLDAISATRPIVVQAVDGHGVWLNSAAIRHYQMDRAPALPAPDEAQRGPDGKPTGVYLGIGHGLWLFDQHERMASDEAFRREMTGALTAAAASGITTVHNLSFSVRAARVLEAMTEAHEMPVRVREYASGHHAAQLEGLRTAVYRDPDVFRMGGVKYFLDGAPLSGNASFEGAASSAAVHMSVDDLKSRLADHARRGEQVALHALGQRAVSTALDAIEGAGPAIRAQRPRIEHADFLFPRDEPRLGPLGVVLSMQPGHFAILAAMGGPPLVPPMDQWGFGRHVRHGLHVGLGSDGPDTPLQSLAHALQGPTPAEAITIEQALRAHTADAAYLGRDEALLGVLSPGRLADLVILSADPRGLRPEQIEALTVEQTWMAGRPTFRREAPAAR